MAGKADILLTARIVDEHGKELTDTYIRDNILTKLNKGNLNEFKAIKKTVSLSDALTAAQSGAKGNIKSTKYHEQKIPELEEYVKKLAEAQAKATKNSAKAAKKVVASATKDVDKSSDTIETTFSGLVDAVNGNLKDVLEAMSKVTDEVEESLENTVNTAVDQTKQAKDNVVAKATGATDNTTKDNSNQGTTTPPDANAQSSNQTQSKKKATPAKKKTTQNKQKQTTTQPPAPTTPPVDPNANGAPTNTQQSKSSSQSNNQPLTKEELEDVFEELDDDQLNFKPWYPQWLIDLINSTTEKPAPQNNLEPMEEDWSKYENKSSDISSYLSSSIQSIGRVALTAINNIAHTLFSKFTQSATTVTSVITNSVKKVFLAPSKELLKSFTSLLKMAINASQIVHSIMNIAIVPFVLMLEYLLIPVIKAIIPYVTKFVKFISDNKNQLLKLGEGIAKFFDVILSAGFDTLSKSKDAFESPISTLLDVMTSMIDAAGVWMKDNALKIFKALESIIISGIEFLSSSAKLSAYIFKAFLTAVSSVFSASNSEFITKAVAVIGGAFANIVSSAWTLIQTNPQVNHAVQAFANLITVTLLKALLDAVSLMEIPVVSWLAGLGSEKLNNYLKETTDWTSSEAYWDIAKQQTDADMARLSTQMNNTTNNNSQIWYISNGAGLGTKDSLLLAGAKYV